MLYEMCEITQILVQRQLKKDKAIAEPRINDI